MHFFSVLQITQTGNDEIIRVYCKPGYNIIIIKVQNYLFRQSIVGSVSLLSNMHNDPSVSLEERMYFL